jgi:predicted oxidoreductase
LALEPLDSGVLDQAQELKMAPMIWSPLAGGRLVNPSFAAKDARVKRVQDTLNTLAAKYGPSVTQDQVCLFESRLVALQRVCNSKY